MEEVPFLNFCVLIWKSCKRWTFPNPKYWSNPYHQLADVTWRRKIFQGSVRAYWVKLKLKIQSCPGVRGPKLRGSSCQPHGSPGCKQGHCKQRHRHQRLWKRRDEGRGRQRQEQERLKSIQSLRAGIRVSGGFRQVGFDFSWIMVFSLDCLSKVLK